MIDIGLSYKYSTRGSKKIDEFLLCIHASLIDDRKKIKTLKKMYFVQKASVYVFMGQRHIFETSDVREHVACMR